ncbi:MAG: hypothetical protein WA941_11805 [Nitrososphaeraceae archaeon]
MALDNASIHRSKKVIDRLKRYHPGNATSSYGIIIRGAASVNTNQPIL